MKKSILILLSLLLSTFGLKVHAQRVTNVRFHQAGDSIVVQYSLFEVPKGKASLIDLYVSTDGGSTFTGPLKKVSGDVGHYITEGQRKAIYWHVMDEMPTFGGNVVFDIRALIDQPPAQATPTRSAQTKESTPKTKKDKSYTRDGDFLLTYTGSTMSPIGLTVGKIGGVGFYLTAASNYAIGNSVNYDVDNSYVINEFNEPGYYEYTGEYAYKRSHFSIGPIFQVANHFNLYAGLRYSIENTIYEYQVFDYTGDVIEESGWVANTNLANKWIGGEGGIMLQFGAFVLGAGVSVPTFTATFNIGFGF